MNSFNVSSFVDFLKQEIHKKYPSNERIKLLISHNFSLNTYSAILSGRNKDVKLMMDLVVIFNIDMNNFFIDQRACCGQYHTCDKACIHLTRHLRECLNQTKRS